jgi:hypothetical protein
LNAEGTRIEPPIITVSRGNIALNLFKLTNISSNSDNSSPDTDHGTLASRASTAGPVLVAWIDGPSGNIVDGFADHKSLGDTSLGVKDGTGFSKESYKDGFAGVVFSEPGYVSHRSLETLSRRRCQYTGFIPPWGFVGIWYLPSHAVGL